jgi:hypothetical protein
MAFDWNGDDFCLLKYFPQTSPNADSVTDFVLAFKSRQDNAVDATGELVAAVVQSMEQQLRDVDCCQYIVAIPPSTAYRVNESCERICSRVAARFGWLKHLDGVLVRTKTVPSSHRSPPWKRPKYADHLASIEYGGPTFSNAGVIMIDDL